MVRESSYCFYDSAQEVIGLGHEASFARYLQTR